jgi:hypothetical protein
VTEAEWNTCTDLLKMLAFLRDSGKADGRRCRLFACAVVRRAWHLLPDERIREAVDSQERHQGGQATPEELAGAQDVVREGQYRHVRGLLRVTGEPRAVGSATQAAYIAVESAYNLSWGEATEEEAGAWVATQAAWASRQALEAGGVKAGDASEELAQSDLLRDIFGPLPFRPVAVPDVWLTWNAGTVRRLAEAADAERQMPGGTLDPARLGVLADALEEAGCTDPDLLGHLRGPGPHVRGCWPVDLLTGRQ